MMDHDLDAAGRSFMDEVQKLCARITRLEMIGELALLPLRPYEDELKVEPVTKWMNARVKETKGTYNVGWEARYTNHFCHRQTGIEVNLVQVQDFNRDKRPLLTAILTIAAIERIAPMKLVIEMMPDIINAVDALASVAE